MAKADQGRDAAHFRLSGPGVVETEAGEEIDSFSGKLAQLFYGARMVARFAIYFAVDRRDLVAADDQGVREFAGDGAGLGFGKAQGEVFRCFAGEGGFVGLRVGDSEWQSEAGEEFAAIRGG